MQLSNTGIGDELTVTGQVTWGVSGQGPVDDSRNLEHATQEASAAGGAYHLVPITSLAAAL